MTQRAVESVVEPISMEYVVGGLTQHVGGNHIRLICGEPSRTPTLTSELTSMKWRKLFTGPMQIFDDADEFRKTLYNYSVGNKFEYTYVKNSNSKRSVKCAVDGCQWNIMANAVGKTTRMLRVTTFIDEHDHSV